MIRTDVLDFFEYSRSDIASLVRRCHHDENQIQIAVANIVEDRANHEKEDWGTVKNKKQAKEERKIKEEEAKKEQERVQKEEEKQRKEAERKAAKEAREAERANKRGGKGGKNGAEMHGASALPPDPAILFAGTKPTEPESSESWQWWESSGDKWAGKSWDWQESWHGDDWGSKADAGWWGQGQGQAEGAQWEKAGGVIQWLDGSYYGSPDSRANHAAGGKASGPPTSPAAGSFGLDPACCSAAPKRAERGGAIQRHYVRQASSSSAPAERAERGGEKGKGKGKKGKGDREKGETEKERLERIDRSDDPRRQAVEQVGEVVTVRKHSSMGCAVVSMVDLRVRQAIVEEGNECMINGIRVQIKPHTNKETKEEVLTDLFVAWGRQVEKVNPLSEQTIAKPAPKHRLAPCLVLCAFLRCCPPLVHVELVGTWLYNMFGPARSTCPGDKPQLALSRRGKHADACEHPEKTPPPRYFDTKHKEMTGRWKAAEEEGGGSVVQIRFQSSTKALQMAR
ncbi:unnamed protein product [Effrenium voratum]|nr:unnamed protein product [Effrenium voratum]